MATKIFVNLPVKSLDASMRFFRQMGYDFNPQFTDENAASMVVSDDIYVMLLTREYFATFTPKEISDATKSTEVLIALSCDSRAEVDATVAKALAAGALRYNDPKDYGFMYSHGFQDLDGHIWELVYMDAAAMEQG